MATVEGDMHDIGKNLVSMMLEGGGFQVHDLGIDVPAGTIISEIERGDYHIVGLSALLTTTMSMMEDTIEKITEAGLIDRVKVLVGGAPVTQDFADRVGAHGYAPDAAIAVSKAKEIMGI